MWGFFWKTKQLLRNLMFLWVKIGDAQNHGKSKYTIIQFIQLQ